jgi:hypothetical protein
MNAKNGRDAIQKQAPSKSRNANSGMNAKNSWDATTRHNVKIPRTEWTSTTAGPKLYQDAIKCQQQMSHKHWWKHQE